MVATLGCSQGGGGGGSSNPSFKAAPEYCSSPTVYSPSVTVESRAQFTFRNVTVLGLTSESAAQDIKYAEVIVTDSSGNAIQCGETDAQGLISVELPKEAGTFTLAVRSRANNSFYKVSVLNSPYESEPYEIKVSFTLDGTENTPQSITLPVARATTSGVLGGAFNILEQVYKANNFLKTNTTCVDCETYTVAPHVDVYWAPGVNPYSYLGQPDSGVSFYYPVTNSTLKKGLYILGGLYGDYNCTDTDHFDNSIVLHEYGHFLEDSVMNSDSPGGAHNGNFIIDPRLAFSEGWANYFQEAVLKTGYYRDTVGNSSCTDGGTALIINYNMESAPSSSTQDGMPPGTEAGEGIYREFAISRVLNDLEEPLLQDSDLQYADLGFAPLWKVFSDDSSTGFAGSSQHFKNAGSYYELLRQWVSANDASKLADFDSALANEYSLSSTSEYAQKLTPQSSCSFTRTITGTADLQDPYSQDPKYVSNLFTSNDFFEFYHDGTKSNLQLFYDLDSGETGPPSDLDLYLYKKDYRYGISSTIVRSSTGSFPESGGTGLESLNISNLSPGTYLINVKVKSDSIESRALYYLEASGERLCP